MGLYVSTTGSSVEIPELGIEIVHPTTDYDMRGQFTHDEIQYAANLTTKIRDGTLTWKKTSGGSVEPATDYDPDFLEVDELNLGDGLKDDRVVTFKDLTGSGGSVGKSGKVLSTVFTGSPIKKATVTFAIAYDDTNYAIAITGFDSRSWTIESKTASGFTISSNANQALTGDVYWIAPYYGGA